MRKVSVQNYLTGSTAYLYPAQTLCNNNTVTQLTKIFNSSEIYKWLFSRKLVGKPFDSIMCEKYLKWCYESYIDGNVFSYILKDRADIIVAGGDLQRVDTHTVTLGYWGNPTQSGYVTNMVKCLIDLALSKGYTTIDAYPEKENIKSIGVLQRNSFQFIEDINKESYVLSKYLYVPE